MSAPRVARPVETALVEVLNGIVAPYLGDRGVRVVRVELAGQSKAGEFRAHLDDPGSALADAAVGRRLVEILSASQEIDKAVLTQTRLHFSVSTKTLAQVLAHSGAGLGDEVVPSGAGVIPTFCSPNANKPLHLGHLRASFLGMAVSRLFETAGVPVLRSQMVSNFGVHICQALAVHERDPVDPASRGVKGDWFVGELYRRYHEEVGPGDADHVPPHDDGSCVRCRSQQLLRAMMAGDEPALSANALLTGWVVAGMAATHDRIGTRYDVEFFEQDSLPVALEALRAASDAGICRRRDDGSVFIDVPDAGPSGLTLLRADGTPVVFTQFLGVHLARGERYPGWRILEFTGEQWRSGRAAMYQVLAKLGRQDLADRIENVWFGMVKLGGATMRSRTGTGVLADTLLDDVRDRVAAWGERPAVLAGDHDRLAVALVKYYMLGFPRRAPIDFDEDQLWTAATEGVGRIAEALAWATTPPASSSGAGGERAGRALALALSREAAVVDRALYQRDPALVVRYLDEVARLALEAAAKEPIDNALHGACARVLNRALDVLALELPMAAARPDLVTC